MALAPYDVVAKGYFVEKEFGRDFQYANNESGFFPDFPHIVFVGPNSESSRYAKVLNTVAHVAVDEDAYGNPVVEKWKIKRHTKYS
jgi:hypothetical protein